MTNDIIPLKLDFKLKANWIDALISGRYKQGRKFYKNDNKFDPLGVLINEIDHKGWYTVGKMWAHPKAKFKYFVDTLYISENQYDTIVDMNDKDEKSFAEIAEWIGDNL